MSQENNSVGSSLTLHVKISMFLSYPLFAFYTELMEVSMLSDGAHNLRHSVKELIVWLSFTPFPRPVDQVYNGGPDYDTILQ